MDSAHLRHRCNKIIDGLRDGSAGFVGRALAAGPDIRRVFDLTHVLAELGYRLFPKHSVAALVEKMFSILRKRIVELFGSHLPHLLHRILPFLTEFEARRALV